MCVYIPTDHYVFNSLSKYIFDSDISIWPYILSTQSKSHLSISIQCIYTTYNLWFIWKHFAHSVQCGAKGDYTETFNTRFTFVYNLFFASWFDSIWGKWKNVTTFELFSWIVIEPGALYISIHQFSFVHMHVYINWF